MSNLRTTTDYDQFGVLDGNRAISHRHVRELKRLITSNGNLNDKFPIKVNANMEILDGQHRYQALRELELPIVYEIIDGANINTVRAINLGNRNWDWKDMAQSYHDLGNDEYGWFLNYVESYNLPFLVALAFCDQPASRGQDSAFNKGYLLVEDKPKAIRIAEHYAEIKEMTKLTHRDFALALRMLAMSEDYNPSRMVKKLAERGDSLPLKATRMDYARELEEIYNHSLSNRVRLF